MQVLNSVEHHKEASCKLERKSGRHLHVVHQGHVDQLVLHSPVFWLPLWQHQSLIINKSGIQSVDLPNALKETVRDLTVAD